MKTKKISPLLGLLIAVFAVTALVGTAVTVEAKSDKAKYKEYKQRYKNDNAKDDFFKVKQIKRDNKAAYQQMKAVYKKYKHNKEAMTPAERMLYKDYSRYRGYKKYKEYKRKVK